MLHLLLKVMTALGEAASRAIQAPNLIFGREQLSFSLNTKVFQDDYFHIHTPLSLFILPDAIFNKHGLKQADTVSLSTAQARL